ncbi:hypothetical protein [Streptomyces melanogenes]|uniref:hypothetical protein n=1 Tax=Streptomyces melanogenes TaxID=67326 RepID=UPI0037A0A218
MEEVTVPAGLQEALSERFGGAGDPELSLSSISLTDEAETLTLSLHLAVVTRRGGREKWLLRFDMAGTDAVAARHDASVEAHRWLALMVKVNVIEWWHTRKIAPNISETPRRIG